ncbi:MAG TPA: alpha-galactosidase [Clostridia bacterium]|nr:alpha-galactosidase [Clostridia bacterium]
MGMEIPFKFSYAGEYIKGFEDSQFKLVSKSVDSNENIIRTESVYDFKDNIRVTAHTETYIEHGVYTWVVWFENIGETETKTIGDLYCMDSVLPGKNPVLKGILGDHQNLYSKYERDLSREDVEFKSLSGRSTHVNFPYFLVESDYESYIVALGWAGTWMTSFNKTDEGTHVLAKGVADFKAYLKPGEKIRTPLMCMMTIGVHRDTDFTMNRWRRWFVEHIMPRKGKFETEPVSPMITNMLAYDTGRPNSDGSISEYHRSWRPSLEKYYAEGLEMDIRWVDAGWYCDPDNSTVPTDWWGTVGTWELDRQKWPGDSFRESVLYAHDHGAYTMLWFEPERITSPESLSKNYGFNQNWMLRDGSHRILVDLGDRDCLDWVFNRIRKTMEETGTHMYREDFNCDPASFWNVRDASERGERKGMAENLYIQGHYELWDGIISYCRENGKLPFVDSCASGGGRNDLESMRRSIPVLRSDNDRTSTALRLSMTTSFNEWIPCCGASTKETTDQLTAGKPDLYVLRASYLPILNYSFEYVHDLSLDYCLLRKGQAEWKTLKPFFYGDFYVLTPWHPHTVTDMWTVFMYFDNGKGVIQAFRQEECENDSVVVRLKGLEPDVLYDISDIDGLTPPAHTRGDVLAEGFEIRLLQKKSAAIMMISKA